MAASLDGAATSTVIRQLAGFFVSSISLRDRLALANLNC
jgi:hypothetical protein